MNQRIAVFADVHGNPYACRAVLQAIRAEGEDVQIVAAGDLCLGGSDPALVVDLLRRAGAHAVFGNTETYLYNPGTPPTDELHRRMWPEIRPAIDWVRARLSADQFAWLEGLPFELRFSPAGSAPDDLLVVHANPRDVELMIYGPPEDQIALWGEVRQPDDDPDLSSALDGVQADVIAFGHFHRTSVRTWQKFTLVDVGPCSLPGIDHDPRARYTLFEQAGSGWQITHRFVTYDVQREEQALLDSSMPNKERFIAYFRK